MADRDPLLGSFLFRVTVRGREEGVEPPTVGSLEAAIGNAVEEQYVASSDGPPVPSVEVRVQGERTDK